MSGDVGESGGGRGDRAQGVSAGTPLARKLGIQAGSRVAVMDPPSNPAALLAPLPDEVEVVAEPGPGSWDVILLFAPTRSALEQRLPEAVPLLDPDGGLWVAWPKKSSPLAEDLDREEVRRQGLAAGLVDNKVCAVDADWSGLRFVYRLEDRDEARARLEGTVGE